MQPGSSDAGRRSLAGTPTGSAFTPNMVGTTTKRAAVDFALRQLVGPTMARDEALQMEGTGWDADLEELRNQGWALRSG